MGPPKYGAPLTLGPEAQVPPHWGTKGVFRTLTKVIKVQETLSFMSQ